MTRRREDQKRTAVRSVGLHVGRLKICVSFLSYSFAGLRAPAGTCFFCQLRKFIGSLFFSHGGQNRSSCQISSFVVPVQAVLRTSASPSLRGRSRWWSDRLHQAASPADASRRHAGIHGRCSSQRSLLHSRSKIGRILQVWGDKQIVFFLAVWYNPPSVMCISCKIQTWHGLIRPLFFCVATFITHASATFRLPLGHAKNASPA